MYFLFVRWVELINFPRVPPLVNYSSSPRSLDIVSWLWLSSVSKCFTLGLSAFAIYAFALIRQALLLCWGDVVGERKYCIPMCVFVFLCLCSCTCVWIECVGVLYICEGFSFALLIRYGRIRVALSYYFNNYLLISCMCGYPFVCLFVCILFVGWCLFVCLLVCCWLILLYLSFCKLLLHYRHLSILFMCWFSFVFLFSCVFLRAVSVLGIRLFVIAQVCRCRLGWCSLLTAVVSRLSAVRFSGYPRV